MRLIHAACQQGLAAVVVTHDAQLASLADRSLLPADGRGAEVLLQQVPEDKARQEPGSSRLAHPRS